MPVTFNHTIIASTDRHESARFLREIFEAAAAPSWGPFTNKDPAGHAIEMITRPYL